jgi:hypothetical protein
MSTFWSFSLKMQWFLSFVLSKNEFWTYFWYLLISWKSQMNTRTPFNMESEKGWKGWDVFGRCWSMWLKPLLYQVLLIGALWVEWNHFQFQQIKHHRWTWTWTGIIFSSMLGILDEKEKMISYVLKCWEQDVMIFNFQRTSYVFVSWKGSVEKHEISSTHWKHRWRHSKTVCDDIWKWFE